MKSHIAYIGPYTMGHVRLNGVSMRRVGQKVIDIADSIAPSILLKNNSRLSWCHRLL